MSSSPYPSLAEWIRTQSSPARELPDWVHPGLGPPAILAQDQIRTRVEGLLATVTAVQRTEWLSSGVWLGPRTFPQAYDDLLHACRRLAVPVPPAIVGPTSSRGQAVLGTDKRATLYLSGAFLTHSTSEARRFGLGQLVGQLAARQVTWRSLHALTSPERELRKLAARVLGPAVDIVLGPVGLAVRAALARWVQGAEITADRAGLLVAGDLDVASRALIRQALLTSTSVDPEAAIAQGERSAALGGARWAELLNDEPALYKRLKALQLFTESTLWPEASGAPSSLLDPATLSQSIDALLETS